jgi:endonuclease/exonuclease/phosphatase family metal-dependent hydrolase
VVLVFTTFVADRKITLLAFLFLVPGFFYVSSFWPFSSQSDESIVANKIPVLSFNVQSGFIIADKDSKKKERNIQKFKNLISQDIKILCLQEMHDRMINLCNPKSYYPYYFQPNQKGTLIASQFKIIDSGEIDFGTKTNSCIWVDLDTPEGFIRVYNVHLQSSRITTDTEKAISESRKTNRIPVTALNNILYKYHKFSIRRAEQAQMVKNHSEQSPYPVIICGDFNETPMSYTYHALSSGLMDTYKKGNRIAMTFPEPFGLIRIDYILASKKLVCSNFEVLSNISLSDHIPIVSTFDVIKQN